MGFEDENFGSDAGIWASRLIYRVWALRLGFGNWASRLEFEARRRRITKRRRRNFLMCESIGHWSL